MKYMLVCGGRDIRDSNGSLAKQLDDFVNAYEVEGIVSGGARGGDAIGERYARENGLRLVVFPANWKRYGKRAGFLRNEQMAAFCAQEGGVVFAFPGGRGTHHMIETARRHGVPVVYNGNLKDLRKDA